MNFLRTYWFLIIAALITIIGILTGWYLFIFLVFPLSFFIRKKKDEDQE